MGFEFLFCFWENSFSCFLPSYALKIVHYIYLELLCVSREGDGIGWQGVWWSGLSKSAQHALLTRSLSLHFVIYPPPHSILLFIGIILNYIKINVERIYIFTTLSPSTCESGIYPTLHLKFLLNVLLKLQLKIGTGDSPGGIQTPSTQCWGSVFDPWSAN